MYQGARQDRGFNGYRITAVNRLDREGVYWTDGRVQEDHISPSHHCTLANQATGRDNAAGEPEARATRKGEPQGDPTERSCL